MFREGKIDEAKKSLNTVNQIYDDVAIRLRTIDRKHLPKYSLSGDKIEEITLKPSKFMGLIIKIK